MNDGIQCYRKTSGTKSGSVVDENYQLVFPNEFVEDDGYNIVLDDYYNCWNEDISFALFGAPFFQNGDWWTFKNIKKVKKGNILSKPHQINDLIVKELNNNDYLMIKGSNSTGLNKFVAKLKTGKSYVV